MARKMKDSGIKWIGEMPEDWKILSLKYLCNMQAGKNLNSEQISIDGEFPVYGGNGLRGYYHTFNCEGLKILVGRQGALCGNVHKVDGKYWATEHAIITEHTDLCDANFLSYLLIGMNLNQYVTSTAAQPGLAVSTIQNIKTCIPKTDEQIRIASFLDNKCARIDSILNKTRTSIEEYKKLKQSIITQAVTKGIRPNRKMKDSGIEWIGEIPEEWTVKKIKWLLHERNERSCNGAEEPLSMSQKYGIIPTRRLDNIPNIASSFVGAKICYKGDLVFNKLKAHLGVFSLSDHYGLVSPDYAVYYSSKNIHLKYLEYLFRTPIYITEFKKRATGVGIGLTRLYTSELYSIHCLLPSNEEQQEIVAYINEKNSRIDNLISKKEQLLTELENYKKSLIFEYVTGKKAVLQ